MSEEDREFVMIKIDYETYYRLKRRRLKGESIDTVIKYLLMAETKLMAGDPWPWKEGWFKIKQTVEPEEEREENYLLEKWR